MGPFGVSWKEYLTYGPLIAAIWIWDQKFAFLLGAGVGATIMYVVK